LAVETDFIFGCSSPIFGLAVEHDIIRTLCLNLTKSIS
jgi:hypothetical protein